MKNVSRRIAELALFSILQHVEHEQESAVVLDEKLDRFEREYPVNSADLWYLKGYERAWRDIWQSRAYVMGYEFEGKLYPAGKLPPGAKSIGETHGVTCWANPDGTLGKVFYYWK